MPHAPLPLPGRWQMIRAELDGESAPELVAQHTELHLTAATYAVRFNGRIIDQGAFETDASRAEKVIVLRGESGPNAGRTIPGIFQLVRDRLRICYGLNGVTPTEFTTAPNQARYLAFYRRV